MVLQQLLLTHPLLVNSLTGSTLCAASDVLAQYIERQHRLGDENDKALDTQRCLGAGFLGAFLGGGVYPYAYRILDRAWPGVDVRSVVTKSLTEIVTVGIFVNSLSLAYRGLVHGHDWNAVRQHVRHELPTVTQNDVRVWFPYNLLAFWWIPIHIRPTTTAAMEASWQTYMSWRSHDYAAEPQPLSL